jgi:hypothetical protein
MHACLICKFVKTQIIQLDSGGLVEKSTFVVIRNQLFVLYVLLPHVRSHVLTGSPAIMRYIFKKELAYGATRS